MDGAGRSATAQLLHASEAAFSFWPDLEAQIASLFQIVPDVDGSEAIIESTANGYNDFHKLWRLAESGASEWLPIFLPWSLDPEYRKKPDEDFTITAEEVELKKLYGLEDAQIAWRRAKQQQLGERLQLLFVSRGPNPLLAAGTSATFTCPFRDAFDHIGFGGDALDEPKAGARIALVGEHDTPWWWHGFWFDPHRETRSIFTLDAKTKPPR